MVPSEILTNRTNVLLTPISPTEIVIFGGWNGHKYLDDALVFDIETESVDVLHPSGFKFFSIGGQSIMTKHDQFAALVTDARDELKFVTYTRSENLIRVIDEIGNFADR